MIEIEGYRLLRQIGAGGMGLVYEAEQLNPRRTVALKVLRGDFLGPRLARRLEFEAQVLGALKHPGIAQIYEAGWFRSENGEQPFFAMEFVRGAPLIAYAEENRLSAEARIELLIKVCEAVEHAHQRGIIHRDLKPANILVEAGGQPKVLDFGLARTVNSDLQALSTCRELEEVVGTILYMSPEQTEGHSDQIDARSDVYALGVIGYELLAGEFPHEHQSRSVFEYFCALKEEDPRPLGALNKAFRGDLEQIFAKALMKEKPLRYATAGALGDDLRRHLAHEPIMARPVSGIYQARKYARRNRVLLAGVCATLLAMAAGLAGTITQAMRAAERAREAEARSKEAVQLRATAEREQYLANISLATLASSQGRVFEAEAALLKAPEHLRGWEWRFLWRLSHPELALLGGHSDGIRDLEYNPDGSRLVSVSDDATGRIWDPKAGTCVAVLRGHAKRVLSGRYSPAGDLIATASDDHTARVWTAEGELKHVLTGHAAPVNKAVFSPDGARIVTASDDGTARLWDAATGACLARMEGHSASVWDVVFDRTGSLIATASDDHTARLWDGTTGRAAAVLRGHEGQVNVVRFHPSENLVLTVSEDATARLWSYGESCLSPHESPAELAAARVVRLIMAMPRWLEFVPDGSKFVVAGRMGKIGVYNGSTGERIDESLQVQSELEDLAVDPRGEGIAVATKGREALFYAWRENGKLESEPWARRGHVHYATCLAFHPRQRVFGSGSADRSVRVWHMDAGRRAIHIFKTSGPVVAARFTDAGELFVLDHKQGFGKPNPAELEGAISASLSVLQCVGGDASRDGKRAVIADETGEMTLWGLRGDEFERTASQQAGILRRLAYSPDGASILATGPGAELSLFSAADGAPVQAFSGHEGELIEAAFTPDGKRTVSVAADRTARVWSSADGKQIHAFKLNAVPSSVCISPDGALCAVGASDSSMTVWSLDSFKEVAHFATEHRSEHLLGIFSPDGSRLVTCTDDQHLKLWETTDFMEVAALPKDAGRVHAMDFSRDGRYLALAYETRKTCIFDAGPPLLSAAPPQEHGEE